MPSREQCTIPQKRNTERIQISVLPADLAEAQRIARERTEPGFHPNYSGAWRMCLRLYLDLEGRGELPEEYRTIPARKGRP
jgi:hypothetical protein